MTNHPLVSVVILNWNKPQDTLVCIKSIKHQSYKNIEIIVVDNGSDDDSVSILNNINGIKLVKNKTNRGFTGGHIDGYQHTNGEFILVLNNDAILDKDYIVNGVKIISKDDNIALVGGRSYEWNGGDIDHSNLDNAEYFSFQTVNVNSGEGIFAKNDKGFDHEVNWVSGSSMLIRRSVIEQVGYFYDPLFAYYEENDLFARIQAYGYVIVYSPSLKIWHRMGISSSNAYQLNQIFKNRFIFAIRNFDNNHLMSFFRSYFKTTIRGSYHYIFKKYHNEEEKILNKALHNSLLNSLIYWPRWVNSRFNIKKIDDSGLSYKDKLKIEQTGISFVVDLSKDYKKIKNLVEFTKTLMYKHFNSEIVLVCNNNDKKELELYMLKVKIPDVIIRVAYNNGNFDINNNNYGWLSSSMDYIWFINPELQPDINIIKNATLLLDNKNSLYVDRLNSDSDISVCISRKILSIYGGLDNKSNKKSLVNLIYFYYYYNNISLKGVFDNLPKPNKNTILKIKNTILEVKDNKNNFFSKLLNKHYRLFQLNNLTQWLFIKNISPRHKLARIRNVLLFSVKLDRKNIALEFKHISNEVIKNRIIGFDIKKRQEDIITSINNSLLGESWRNTPVFIICRDRLSPLEDLLDWLNKMKMNNIILVDNNSKYPKLVEFLDSTHYQVIKTNKNIGHTVVWNEGIIKTLCPGQFYIVSDPDVIPNKDCPKNVIEYFYEIHKKYINHQKVGFGLQIDDIPDKYNLKNHVINWEGQFWENELEKNIFEASIDTTFALYKPYTYYYILSPSLRTGKPYTARHLPWYVDSSKINEEEYFYRLRANQDVTSWNVDEISERYIKELNK